MRCVVGPASAGAEPGPACYGQGGERPTITDAALLMGILDPDGFAAGEMPWTPASPAAFEALATRLRLRAAVALRVPDGAEQHR